MFNKGQALAFKNPIKKSTKKISSDRMTVSHNVKLAILLVFIFFLARASLFGGLYPFGLALWCALLMIDSRYMVTGFLVILGLISTGIDMRILKYGIPMMLMGLLIGKNFIDVKKKKLYLTCVFLSFFLPSFIKLLTQGIYYYDFSLLLLEGLSIPMLAYLFQKGCSVLVSKWKRKMLTTEEQISIGIIVILFVCGFFDFRPLGVSVKNVLGLVLVLLFSYIGGPGTGTVMGILVGLTMTLSSINPYPIAIINYGICAMTAGLFRGLGKMGSGISFLLANAVVTYYINRSTSVMIPVGEIIVALAILLLIPKGVIDRISKYTDISMYKKYMENMYSKEIKELTTDQLKEFSRVFVELARTFKKIGGGKIEKNQDVTGFLNHVVEKTCSQCVLFSTCWQRDFYNTYNVFFDSLERLEDSGNIDKASIPVDLIKKCIKVDDIVRQMNATYELYTLNHKWKTRLSESKELVAQQLEGIARSIDELAAEVSMDITFKDEISEVLHFAMDRAGVAVDSITVGENKDGKLEITLTPIQCKGTFRSCISHIEHTVSKAVGRKMVCKSDCKQPGKIRHRCILQFYEADSFEVVTGVCRRSKLKDGVSGDSYSFGYIRNGKYMLILSDGMGTGLKAREQSEATVNLIEQFMEAGFGKDITIKTINSALLLRNNDESFATADICFIDLVDGLGEFIKIGAPPSFIKRGDGVQTIKASTLPIGILMDIKVENSYTKLKADDFIIMMTDGVLEANKNCTDTEAWMKEVLMDIKTKNPQQMSELIMETALKYCGGNLEDDMTVMVARLLKC
ncbi:MAG TPA: stage II sporulation protein E [Clostridiales bacterium]|nr:stage II sporulation protein E [Clostridiales bacterium]